MQGVNGFPGSTDSMLDEKNPMAALMMKGVENSGDMLVGALKLDSQSRLAGSFPQLAEMMGSNPAYVLDLDGDRHANISAVDGILERHSVWLSLQGYKLLYDSSELRAVGDAILLDGKVYVLDRSTPQEMCIGWAVHGFFKAAADSYAKHANKKNIHHCLAVIDSPGGKLIILTTFLGEKPSDLN